MKNSGLSNRFSQETRLEWLYWYSCNVCHRNQYTALHHIISPSVGWYVRGNHNTSVLNSCPIHNLKCHIGNEAYLCKRETIELLLSRTLNALIELGYTLNEKDREFLKIYKDLYTKDALKMI